ncbi:alpha/beta hydrolase [Fictibacillus sp. KIGAM418]|uniref:Alpha/beta hydrolase n=1 Tax=Fictibacillus marinisediminis TaxID=2878389 RepID=A0A9X2BCC5_9BACL|nr:alpha/beta fold hydrolase [Fictibacillus marinisediminis]MCK6256316.1 alpha/beta hydrolase [Fictibacillus marinisediminis]
MNKKLKLVLIILLVLLVVYAGGFFIWTQKTFKPTAQLNQLVDVKNEVQHKDGLYIFKPKNKEPRDGVIFYPGAKVEPTAYSYWAKKVADAGYLVVIPEMPLNLALLGKNKAEEAMKADPDIKKWYIAGHSLGGSAASAYALKHPHKIKGMIFLGSYTTEGSNLSNAHFPLLSIYGERDGLSTKAKISGYKSFNPADTTYYEIKGGNNAQFGMYGPQAGDKKAGISNKKQQDQVIKEILSWLNKENRH